DTAVVTVAQAAAAIGVSPARDTIEAGATVQLVADVNDANGFAIENADVIWESSDTTIAVVNTSGLVTGRFRGEARIRARAAAAEGGTDLTVVLVDFNPTANTTIGGTVAYGRFEIPKGVTVTVTSDLALRALDSLRIAGTLIGDCVEMGILVGGPMRVQGGTIDNSCSTARSTWPALRMVTTDVIDFDSATVIAELLRITNDSVISAPSRSGASAAFSAATAPRP